MKRLHLVLAGFALLFAILFIRERMIRRTYEQSKFFSYSWNVKTSKLYEIDTRNNKVIAVSEDDNLNYNYELFKTFYPNKMVNSISYDRDENGYYESTVFYDLEGNEAGHEKAVSDNDRIDYITYLLEDGNKIILTDYDGNGRFQKEE